MSKSALDLTDRELIGGCLQGDKRSWDLFVERFSKLIHWSVRKTLENSSFRSRSGLHEEIFQEVFVRLLERRELERLKNIESIRKYLCVMACHAAMDKIKSLSRLEKKMVFSADETLQIDSAVAAPVANESRDREISDLLDGLSMKERTCVEFHYMDAKSHREIGLILGMPQDTVSTVIRRTREKLKAKLIEKGLA